MFFEDTSKFFRGYGKVLFFGYTAFFSFVAIYKLLDPQGQRALINGACYYLLTTIEVLAVFFIWTKLSLFSLLFLLVLLFGGAAIDLFFPVKSCGCFGGIDPGVGVHMITVSALGVVTVFLIWTLLNSKKTLKG